MRTRFAPSPTGYLHIGGVRTALFNWLLAKRHGGQFILRIDDTDTERNRSEALQPILDGFRWLGMQWDEGPEVDGPVGPYYQSQKLQRYRDEALRLLAAGHAYPDYMTKDELEAERDVAKAAKVPYVHRGPHRNTPANECLRLYNEKPAPLRFKVPTGEVSVIEDKICGHVEQQTDGIGDPVILRAPDADGTARALYNFATVIDDHDMKITHVVRAREHLSNTYTQVLFFRALGYELPIFGHVPVVNEPAPKPGAVYAEGVKPPNPKKKLSKREMAKFVTPEVRTALNLVGFTEEDIEKRDDLNPATVAFYRELGYLPAGLVNYLGRLGWSLDDKSEIIELPEMMANFSLERVKDSPASFDPDKLYWVAGEYMAKLTDDERLAGCLPFLTRAKMISDPVTPSELDVVRRIVVASGPRIKLFSDILVYAAPILNSEPFHDAKAFEKAFKKANAVENVKAYATMLEKASPFDAPTLQAATEAFCKERNIKLNEVQLPVRVSITGTDKGFGLFETLELLGPTECLRRIGNALRTHPNPERQ